MAKFILKDVSFVYNSVDLSDHVESIEIPAESATQDQTCMGANTVHALAGLKSGDITVNFRQDFAASEVNITLFADWSAGTSRTVVIMPTSAGVSATNPSFTVTAFVSSYAPITGTVGDVASAPITLTISSGDLVQATT